MNLTFVSYNPIEVTFSNNGVVIHDQGKYQKLYPLYRMEHIVVTRYS